MDPIHLTTPEAIFLGALINALIGLVLGLIPLLFGYFQGQLRLGIIGIVFSTIGGSILGVFLSVPAVIIFTGTIVASKLVRTIIAAVTTLAGALLAAFGFAAAFGFVSMNSLFSQIEDASRMSELIARGFIIEGLSFVIMGIVSFLISVWPVFASTTDTSADASDSDSENN